MVDLSKSLNENSDLFNQVMKFTDDQYNESFKQFFSLQKTLYNRLHSQSSPVTDEELSSILYTIPLELFAVSGNLNRYRTALEALKLKIKHDSDSNVGDKMLVKCYECVISRVETEMSFSRELIMSAKKIWDSRRRVDGSMPVSEQNLPDEDSSTDLPEYSVPSKTYVK